MQRDAISAMLLQAYGGWFHTRFHCVFHKGCRIRPALWAGNPSQQAYSKRGIPFHPTCVLCFVFIIHRSLLFFIPFVTGVWRMPFRFCCGVNITFWCSKFAWVWYPFCCVTKNAYPVLPKVQKEPLTDRIGGAHKGIYTIRSICPGVDIFYSSGSCRTPLWIISAKSWMIFLCNSSLLFAISSANCSRKR